MVVTAEVKTDNVMSSNFLYTLYFSTYTASIQEFHRKYVLVPEDKAANNVLVD